jgi:hypothetical protein
MEYTRGIDDEFEFKVNNDVLELRVPLKNHPGRVSKRGDSFLVATSRSFFRLFDETGARDETLTLNVTIRKREADDPYGE